MLPLANGRVKLCSLGTYHSCGLAVSRTGTNHMGEPERNAARSEARSRPNPITHVIQLPTCDRRAGARDALAMQSRDYRLIVEGQLSDEAAQAFEPMTLGREGGTTILVGPIRDQAELQGPFWRMSDLGLTLLHADATDRPPEPSTDGRSRPFRSCWRTAPVRRIVTSTCANCATDRSRLPARNRPSAITRRSSTRSTRGVSRRPSRRSCRSSGRREARWTSSRV
jgi:hypothetical protein